MGPGDDVCEAVLSAPEGVEGRWSDQAVGAIGRRGPVRVRPHARARAAAAAVPERRREGRDRRLRGEARGGLQGPVKTDLLIGNELRTGGGAKHYDPYNTAKEEPIAEYVVE